MKSALFTCLWLASAAALAAQNATVENAAVYQASREYFITLNSQLVTDIFFAPAAFETTTTNIISPRMLAVLTYPVTNLIPNPFAAPVPQPVTATLYLRPTGSTTLIPVNVSSAVQGAVTFVVPGYAPLGGAELLYQIDNGPTQWTTVTIEQSSFAFFRTGIGGPAIAQSIPSSGPGFTVGLATPIQPGQTLLLTGSGLGYGTTVTATIGGVSAPVIYAGPSGTAPAGNDQIQLQVPQGVTPGCYVPVAVTLNAVTQTTTISETADGSPCQHPWQLSLNDMKTLDSGGSLIDAPIDLETDLSVVTAAAGSRNESASMYLSTISGAQLAGYFQPPPLPSGCISLTEANVGFIGAAFTVAILASAPSPPPIPDIGSSVTLQSPTTAIQLKSVVAGDYSAQNLPPPVDGPLSNLPAPAIAGGKWTFRSSGGADLPASSFGFTLPAPVQLAGGVPVLMNHTQDQTVSWNGAAFDAGATAGISLQGSGAISCTAPASAGTVTIPAALLSGFNANTIGTLTISISEAGANLPHAQFQTKEGNTLLLFVPSSSSDSRPVFFQ